MSAAATSGDAATVPTLASLLALKQQWESHLVAAAAVDSAAAVSSSLAHLWSHRGAMTTDLLRDSGLGKTLNKLRRKVQGEAAATAAQLLDSWKATAGATIAAAGAAATIKSSPAPVTPAAAAAASPVSALTKFISASSSSSPPPSLPTDDAESLSRKRKASEVSAPVPSPASSSAPQPGKRLAQTALAGMDYPVPVRVVAPPQPTLPAADAFFAKPPPSKSPTAASVRTTGRPAVSVSRSLPAAGRMSATDEFRSKIRIQLCRCFPASTPASSPTAAASSPPGGASDEFSPDVIEVATEIEAVLFHLSKGDVGAAYRTKSREIAMNLRDARNPELRERVFSGAISVHALLTMPFTELASAALKSEREKALAWEMQERRCDVSAHVTVTDAWRCGKCRERKCSYYQMQTRSADEPMTTFVRCIACGNRWRC